MKTAVELHKAIDLLEQTRQRKRKLFKDRPVVYRGPFEGDLLQIQVCPPNVCGVNPQSSLTLKTPLWLASR